MFQLPEELAFLKNRKAPQRQTEASFSGRWVVITGATSGIGLNTAFRFAAYQANLILVVRNQRNGEALRDDLIAQYGIACVCVVADFEDLNSVRSAADRVLALKLSIAVLINNAGIHSTTRVFTPSGFEQVFVVNHLASFLLTHQLMPSMAPQARVIFVNSEGHRFAHFDLEDPNFTRRFYTGLRSYGASKSAQLMCVRSMAKRLRKELTVIAMHPGDVRSNIGRNNGWLYRVFSKWFIQPNLQDVNIASSALHVLALASDIDQHSGAFFHLTQLEVPAKHVLDDALADRVYQKSCDWVKLEPVLMLKESE
jgi:NAD(P)-dependent dehydrogenase (short-subunit alcohol dehydrogenase family)